jgi:hypothetical protein
MLRKNASKSWYVGLHCLKRFSVKLVGIIRKALGKTSSKNYASTVNTINVTKTLLMCARSQSYDRELGTTPAL